MIRIAELSGHQQHIHTYLHTHMHVRIVTVRIFSEHLRANKNVYRRNREKKKINRTKNGTHTHTQIYTLLMKICFVLCNAVSTFYNSTVERVGQQDNDIECKKDCMPLNHSLKM